MIFYQLKYNALKLKLKIFTYLQYKLKLFTLEMYLYNIITTQFSFKVPTHRVYMEDTYLLAFGSVWTQKESLSQTKLKTTRLNSPREGVGSSLCANYINLISVRVRGIITNSSFRQTSKDLFEKEGSFFSVYFSFRKEKERPKTL